MRGLSFLAILLLILCAPPSPATAQATARSDSAAASPSGLAPSPVIVLLLEHGDTRDVIFIKPRADGMAEVTGVDGRVDYIPLYKIQHIEDASGEDRTAEVLRQGHPLGVASPEPIGGWRRFRVRAGPRSACGSYLIAETSLLWRTSSRTGRYEDDKSRFVDLDLGYARNVGAATSVGATAFFGADKARVHSGLRLRVVRWLSPVVSLDVSPGLVLLANEEGESKFLGPGLSSQAGLSIGGRVGLLTQVSSVRIREPLFSPNAGTVVRNTDWYAGVRLEGQAGILGAAAIVGLALLALGSL